VYFTGANMSELTYEKKIGTTTFIITPTFSEKISIEELIKSAIKRDIELRVQTEKTRLS
jgi:hypothetical protein